jgi:hypothetical protein
MKWMLVKEMFHLYINNYEFASLLSLVINSLSEQCVDNLLVHGILLTLVMKQKKNQD